MENRGRHDLLPRFTAACQALVAYYQRIAAGLAGEHGLAYPADLEHLVRQQLRDLG
jgi:hypothetical protein